MGIFVLLSLKNIQAADISSNTTGGSWTAGATWVGGSVPSAGDNVTIAAGATVTIDADPSVGSLTIYGTLQYEASTARTLTVAGIVTINSGGRFKSAPSASTSTITSHSLVVGGSIINNGILDFSAAAGAGGTTANASGAGITFTGTSNATFDFSSATLTNLRQTGGVVLNKGTSASSVLSFIPGGTFQVVSANTVGFLTIANGTFSIIGSTAFNNPVFSTASYTIPTTGGFWLGNANATVTAMDGTATNLGDLKITSGTFLVGSSAEHALKSGSGGQFKMAGGTLIVSGGLEIESGTASISGGTINLASSARTGSEPTLSVSAQSRFEMYGDPLITLAFPHSKNVPGNDIQILGGSGFKSIKGGRIQLGTEETPAGSTFLVNSGPELSNLTVFNECAIRVRNTSGADLQSTPIDSLPLIVFDRIAPELVSPAKITLTCGDQIPAVFPSLQEFARAGGAASDNCTLLPASFKLAGQVQSSANCPYTITRTYEVKDNSGNVGTAEHLIVVEGGATETPTEAVVEPEKEQVLRLKSAMADYIAAVSGNWSDPATWGGAVPTATDNVTIPAGVTVTVDAAAVCNDITIQAGGTLTSGGAFTLQVNGNWTNNGTYTPGTNGIIEFAGANPATIGGTATTVFKQFIVNKGALANIVQVANNIQLNGDITFTSGTMQVNSGVTVTCTHNSGFTIEQTAGLRILGTFTSGAFSIDNKGVFEVAGGTANLGTVAGNSLTIRSTGDFILSAGQVNIAGRFDLSGGDAAISGGTMNINTVGNNSASPSFHLSLTSVFNMTGGNITFQNANGNGNLDMQIENSSGSKTFSNGSITFGTGAVTTYRIESDVPFPSNIVAAANTNLILKMMVSGNGTYNFPLFTSGGVSIPATINLTSNGGLAADASIQIETTGSKHPNNESDVNFLNRYWTVTTSGITSPVYNVTAAYANTDIAGTETEIAMGSYGGSLPWVKYGNANTGANTISATGITAVSFSFAGITNDPPTVTASASLTNICLGASSNLTATPVGDAPFGYSWSPATGLSSTSIANPVATPAVTAVYTITVTDGNGFTASATTTITVLPDNTVSAASSTPTLCINTALTNITHATTGATGIGAATGLPTGVTAAWASNTITISGTPTASGTFNYSIPLTGGCGTVAATGTITVNPNNTVSAASSTPTLCINTALTAITHTATGATNIGAAIGLPTGVTAAWAANTITISGTPTASGTFNYSIPLTGGCGTVTATGTITVNPNNTVSAASSTPTLCINTALTAITHNTTGATNIGAATGLPAGVTATWASNTITISGTPTVSGTFNYSIPLTGGCGTVTATGTITVNPEPTLSNATQAAVVCAGSAASINLTGLVSNTTFTLNYTINSVAQTAVTGLTADPSGNSSFTTANLTATNNGQTLQITGITITSATPNCSKTFTQNVTLQVNSAPVLTTCPTATINQNTVAGTCSATATYTVDASGTPGATYTYTFTGATTGSGNGTGSGSSFNVGNTIVKVTASNTCGSVECTFTVTVTDSEAPVISNCPANVSVFTGAGRTTCDQTATWTEPTATDNCTASGSLVWTKSHLPGATFPVGTTTVTYSVRDASGNASTCTFTVTVIDNTPPTFNAPAATTIFTDASCSFNKASTQTGSPSLLNDNCTAAASLAINYTDTATPTTFCSPGNTITRTWTVTDAAGNTSTKTQLITIEDKTNPQITVPPDKTVQCGGNTFPYAVGLNPGTETATATDNCGGTISITYTDSSPVGGTCDKTITRTWRATDACGNFSTGTQLIRVSDTTNPTVTIPSIYATCASTIPDAYSTIAEMIAGTVTGTATDNCTAGLTITLTSEVANGLAGKPGYCPSDLDRTYRVTDDCGNYTDVIQKVYVGNECECTYCTAETVFEWVDFMGDPDASVTFEDVRRNGKCCPDDEWWTQKKADQYRCVSFNVRLDWDAVGVEIIFEAGATPDVKDWRVDCQPVTLIGNTVCLPGGAFHLFTYCKQGNNPNDITFRSIKGASANSELATRVECNQNLSVTGVSNPVWKSIYPVSVGEPEGYYNKYLYAPGSDIPGSGVNTSTAVFRADDDSPPEIRYEVCGDLAQTVCNNISRDCDIVTVYVKEKIDIILDINPDLVCEDNIPTITPAITPAGNYTLDWISPNPPGGTFRGPSFTPTVAGTYTVVITDIQGGIPCSTVTSTFTIAYDQTGPNFQVTEPPLEIQCNEADYVNTINTWRSKFQATYINAQGNTVTATVTDDFDFSKLNMTCGNVVTVTFTAPDQCINYSTATSTITVIDNIAPTITIAAQNMTVECDGAGNIADLNAWLLNNGGAVSADNCGTVSWTNNYSALSNLCGMTGQATVTFTATDDCGNTVTSTATFSIIDTTPPAITCPGPYYQNANLGTCIAFPVNFGTATVTNSCGTYTVTNNAPAQFPVGVTTITWTATDDCGNVSTCEQYVTIYDIEAPVIDCTTTIIYATVGPGQCDVAVGLITPTYTENCNANGAPTVTVTRSDGLPASANFPVGTTTVVWTVADIYNNFATCTQTVIVTDNVAPTIACPADVVATAPTATCQMLVTPIGFPTINDNCGTYTLTWTKSGATTGSGVGDVNNTMFNGGVTSVTYTVTDAAGNSASCSFTVTVNDQVPPTITNCPPDVLETALTDLCQFTVTSVPQPTAIDPCGTIVSMTHNSPYATNSSTTDASGIYPVGTTTITWTVTDNVGNIATCVQTVTVTDRQLPELACPGDATFPADFGVAYKVNVPINLPTFSDNCPGAWLTWTMGGATTDTSTNTTGFSTVPTPYPQLNVGLTTITYSITDVSGQTVSCSFTITIVSRPEIDCPASITTYTASNNCGADVDPGIPTLIQGAQPITWVWTIDQPDGSTVSGTSTGAVPAPIGTRTFQYGTSTITWSASNISGTDSCTQTVTVIDNIPPVYTPPPTPVEYCVENLFSASYSASNPDLVVINPDPDHFLFRTGINSDTTLDLNVTNLTDNCCPGTTTWTITFSPVPDPASPGNTITDPPVSGTGQPSAHPSNIPIWGDGVTYDPVVHEIEYTVTDCHGNSTTFTRSITVNPRPEITKMN